MLDLYELEYEQLAALLAELQQPAYRARQVWEWVYRHGARDFGTMTNLPLALREVLAARAALTAVQPVEERRDEESAKWLLDLERGGHVEAAKLAAEDGWTACLSTQVGCAMGCTFCASGADGLERNLTAGEIVGQLFALGASDVKSLVFMGMGEPLHNYDALVAAIHRFADERGLAMSPGRMTVSTCGVVPAIRRFGEERLRTHLAVSLNAPDDDLRARLMPGAAQYPVREIISACRDYVKSSGRRVTFAYVLLGGVNDADAEANKLARLLHALTCHVNLIPYNPTDSGDFRTPSRERVEAFARVLRQAGLETTVRFTKGRGVQAACGQLRLKRRAV